MSWLFARLFVSVLDFVCLFAFVFGYCNIVTIVLSADLIVLILLCELLVGDCFGCLFVDSGGCWFGFVVV